ncbi:MAG: radical SAM protein [Isosphaeraceae bacterium]|nr:radical SAM protein [Isosphaeraceae bacterium]
MQAPTLVLVSSITARGELDSYSEDFAQVKLSESLALGYLKAYFSANHPEWRVITINPMVPPITIDEVARLALGHQPVLVGISLVHQWHRNFALGLARRIRSLDNSIHITIGGVYPTSDWAGMLRLGSGLFDSVCRGEGEETLHELALALLSNSNWRNVPGIAYMKEGTPCFPNTRRRIQDLTTLPFPDRSQLDGVVSAGGVIQVEGSRGCNAACIFCDMRQTGWIARPADHIARELEVLTKSHPGSPVWFIDNMFIGFGPDKIDRIKSLICEIKKRDIKIQFSFQDRAENIDESLLRELKKSGLNTIYVGIESFSDRALRRWKKGVSADTNKRALAVLKKLRIFAQIGFIAFDRSTSLEELSENLDGLKQAASNNPFLHLYNMNELIPYSGTFLAETYQEPSERELQESPAGKESFADRAISRFKDRSWSYLTWLWPVTRTIFAHFDQREFQRMVSPVIRAKNQQLIKTLEVLFSETLAHSSDAGLEETYRRCRRETRNALRSSMRRLGSSTGAEALSAAIESLE